MRTLVHTDTWTWGHADRRACGHADRCTRGHTDTHALLPRGASSPAKSVTTGVEGEWPQVQSKGAARRLKQPQQPTSAGGSAASGFTRPGAQR
eukprot:14769154-Alexandrium_andersonii.AAC.1